MARYPLCNATDIPVGQMKRFKVNGAKVLVYHLTDGYYATQSNCTHTFGPLQRGKIIDDSVRSSVRSIARVLTFARGRLSDGRISHQGYRC